MLGEIVGWRRSIVTLVGFLGIVVYSRPFTAGFDPGVFVGAAGALTGALVVVCIKRLATTEPTPVHHVLLRVLDRDAVVHPDDLVVGDADRVRAGAAGPGRRSSASSASG